ncbi:MAG: class II fumarate hydratase [Pseudomonadota bacterium]|nr:class II fumarate hydratase [Pseudomonadota bacterium]
MTTRTETDNMGSIKIDDKHHWGAQTERARTFFNYPTPMPTNLIKNIALVKQAAAHANSQLGLLDPDKAHAIQEVAQEIIDHKHPQAFPLPVWISGSGTQCNMNINEVIANLANLKLGHQKGSNTPIHPNDDVNKSQSTNDIFPTAMHITSATMLHDQLLPALQSLSESLSKKSRQWQDIIKIGRTHLQDAVPLTLGQEFSGFVSQLEANQQRLQANLPELYQLCLGGTAVGTGLNAPNAYAQKAIAWLAAQTQLPFTEAPNKFALQASHDCLVSVMGDLKRLAVTLFKIVNDLRLLGSGPRCGLGELNLPKNEPGSSIMPGKVNPTQCESIAMICAQVMGYDVAVSIAGSGGHLQMNVYKPLIIYNICESITLLASSCVHLKNFTVDTIEPNLEHINQHLNNSLKLVTALNPYIGYDKASQLAHYAYQHHTTLEEANQILKMLPMAQFKKLIDPKNLV